MTMALPESLVRAAPIRSAGRTVLRFHRILSLVASVFWLLQALSGVLIVFHWEMNDATVAGAARPVDIGALSRQMETLPRTAGLGWTFQSIWVTAGQPDRFDIKIGNEATGETRSIRVAGDGSVLRNRSSNDQWRNGAWVGTLVEFHHNLLGGDLGAWIVGCSGVLLLTNILLGLKLAWPRRRLWRRSLLPRKTRPGPARIHSWHRAIGLWLALPALVSVSCGTLLVFHDELVEALGASPAVVAEPSNAPLRIGPEQAIAIARGQFREASLVALYPPSAEAPWYDIRLLQPNELRRAYGTTNVAIDARTGAVLRLHDPATAAASRTFTDGLFPIHTGEAGGLAGRLLVMLIGLWLATMIILGLRLWWLRRR